MISTIGRDEHGQRVGRCGDWYVRARRGSYDLALTLDNWEGVFSGLTIDQAARLLGLPQGDLHEWGRE